MGDARKLKHGHIKGSDILEEEEAKTVTVLFMNMENVYVVGV